MKYETQRPHIALTPFKQEDGRWNNETLFTRLLTKIQSLPEADFLKRAELYLVGAVGDISEKL